MTKMYSALQSFNEPTRTAYSTDYRVYFLLCSREYNTEYFTCPGLWHVLPSLHSSHDLFENHARHGRKSQEGILPSAGTERTPTFVFLVLSKSNQCEVGDVGIKLHTSQRTQKQPNKQVHMHCRIEEGFLNCAQPKDTIKLRCLLLILGCNLPRILQYVTIRLG